VPFDALVMSILLEQELELERLSTQVEALRECRAP